MSELIYLDHHATTPVRPEVVAAMSPYWAGEFGNPSSAHGFGRRARRALEDARESLAASLGAFADEVLFTSGATESNNLAITGQLWEPGVIIASVADHPCVVEPVKHFASHGYQARPLHYDETGHYDLAAFDGIEWATVRLVAATWVHHEIGTVQDVTRLRELIPEPTGFHIDAAQAVGRVRVNFRETGATTLSISGHKFGAPKGIGALLVRRCTSFTPIIRGGGQQRGLRPGTENVAFAVGMAEAARHGVQELAERQRQYHRLREAFLRELSSATDARPLGSEPLAHSCALVLLPGCRAELFLAKLDRLGIACSAGAACASGTSLPSPVLADLGVPDESRASVLRFSFSPRQGEDEIARAGRVVGEAAEAFQAMERRFTT